MSDQAQDIPYQIWTWWERSFSAPNTEVEPNNNLASATNLGQYGIGQLSSNDVDYWSVEVPAQGDFATVMTACLAPPKGQTTISSGFTLAFMNAAGEQVLSVNGGTRGRCMNIRPQTSGRFYFSVQASGTAGGYILAVSYDCAACKHFDFFPILLN